MHSEKWQNNLGDIAIFVGEDYVIYDKIDRTDVDILALHRGRHDTNMDDVKLAYYKNGFRPIDETKANKGLCFMCKYNSTCCTGDDTNKCCNCNQGVKCPDQQMKYNNFEITQMKKYEDMIKNKETTCNE